METTILVAIAAALAGLLGHFVKQTFELLEEIQAALHVLRNKKAVTLKPEVTSRVVTWGSYEVILACAQLRRRLTSQKPNVPEIKKLLGDLLVGIRKDLGHADRQAPARFDELTAMLFSADV